MFQKKFSLVKADVPPLLTVAHKFGDWIISLLQLYIIINSAFVGWIFTATPTWGIFGKIMVTTVYLTAMITNFLWMYKLSCWLKTISNQISQIVKPSGNNDPMSEIKTITKEIEKPKILKYELWGLNLWHLLFALHIISDFAVLLSIWCWT